MKCLTCQTHEARQDSNFCSVSCATVYSIVVSQHFVLTSQQISSIALDRLNDTSIRCSKD